MIYNFENLEFQMLTVARFFHQEGVYCVKARPYAALSFRVSGTCRFEIDNKRFIAKPGDVLFIPANMPYKAEYSVGESIVAHFSYCNYPEPNNICLESSATIDIQFQWLLETWSEQHSNNQAKSIIYDILEKIDNNKKMSIAATPLVNCIQYMDEHFRDPNLDIEAVCNIGFMSVSSLQRAFNKYLRVSPKQYLIRLRMNHALNLLTMNELSVKEIAFACGFTDEKYFSRAFKKKYGYSPSQIRSV